MKYEPLKGKVLLWNQITGDIETTDGKYFLETKTEDAKFFRILLKKDVKSAVQGLLEEIGKMEKFYENMREQHREDKELNHVFTAKRDTVSRIKNKIKKWFADVIDKKEER